MPRTARNLVANTYYHIVQRGNNRHTVFHKPQDYLYYLYLMNRYRGHSREAIFELFHYCLMPNHVHFLVRICLPKQFPVFMQRLNLAYHYYYNQHYQWLGYFWQNRYKSLILATDMDILNCARYIERNPVTANLVTEPEEYEFSSYRYYHNQKKYSLLTRNPYYRQAILEGQKLKRRQ